MEYGGNVTKKIAKSAERLQPQMRSHLFDSFGLISIISVLSVFRLACDINEIQEGAAIWLFHSFMKGSSTAALNTRICLKTTSLSNTLRVKERMLTTCQKVMSYLHQTYAADAALTRSIQQSTMSHTKYVKALVTTLLRW